MLGYLRMEQYHHLLREMQWRSTGIVREGEEERRYRKRRGRRKKKRRMIEEYRNALETGNLQSSGTDRNIDGVVVDEKDIEWTGLRSASFSPSTSPLRDSC